MGKFFPLFALVNRTGKQKPSIFPNIFVLQRSIFNLFPNFLQTLKRGTDVGVQPSPLKVYDMLCLGGFRQPDWQPDRPHRLKDPILRAPEEAHAADIAPCNLITTRREVTFWVGA